VAGEVITKDPPSDLRGIDVVRHQMQNAKGKQDMPINEPTGVYPRGSSAGMAIERKCFSGMDVGLPPWVSPNPMNDTSLRNDPKKLADMSIRDAVAAQMCGGPTAEASEILRNIGRIYGMLPKAPMGVTVVPDELAEAKKRIAELELLAEERRQMLKTEQINRDHTVGGLSSMIKGYKTALSEATKECLRLGHELADARKDITELKKQNNRLGIRQLATVGIKGHPNLNGGSPLDGNAVISSGETWTFTKPLPTPRHITIAATVAPLASAPAAAPPFPHSCFDALPMERRAIVEMLSAKVKD
jgi:hypothetical protein